MKRIGMMLFSLCTYLFAGGTPAGTVISNVAQLNYTMNAVTHTVVSNTITDIVDQILEPVIVCNESDAVGVTSGASNVPLRFVLSNAGNGEDTMQLSAEDNGTGFGVLNPRVYLDDGDGYFEPNQDTLVTQITLQADENATLFFVSDIPSDYNVTQEAYGIEAKSKIGGSGIPGTSVKHGVYYAVDGYKGGKDIAFCLYRLNTVQLRLEKRASVSSKRLYVGSTIHYTIRVSLDGYGTLNDIIVKDKLPQGTSYVPGSLQLDGNSLSDSLVSNGELNVPIGSMSKTTSLDPTHILTFDVKVIP